MATSNGPMGTSNVRSSTLRQTRTNPSRQSKTAGRTSILNHVVNPFNNHAHNPSLAGGPGNVGAGSYAGGGARYGAASQHPAGLILGIHHFNDAIDAILKIVPETNIVLDEVDGKGVCVGSTAAEVVAGCGRVNFGAVSDSWVGWSTNGITGEIGCEEAGFSEYSEHPH
ncbi:hypothetical protein CIHG_05963 [Coccidioides immitis H538.4]|uniref:Uncharacterized protein n=1 Tax=Coccidioides immitis H538.4 TaxID=396776 RepID=A0A0J8RR11_COCIT|nr:hypothetical protein CIHG_05963 [Coccidioides immitis H538.4]